jgi:DNA-binding NarL/FixJ family response regulator
MSREYWDGSDEGVRPVVAHDGQPRQVALTEHERVVLTASARGLSVLEVSELLGLSSDTVRGLIASAIQTLGARSKLEVVMLALRHGLIDPPA